MKRWLLLLTFIIAVRVAAQTNEAIENFDAGLGGTFNGTAGWTFQPTLNIAVDALGVFSRVVTNYGAVEVGLWNSSGTLLASNLITINSTLINATRYAPISEIDLLLGQTYYIGAIGTNGSIGADVVSPPDGFTATTAPQIHLGTVAYVTNGVFEFPSQTEGAQGSGFMAPNLEFQQVPEPSVSGLAALGGAMAITAATRRWRSRRPQGRGN